jgi:hypothetical protein
MRKSLQGSKNPLRGTQMPLQGMQTALRDMRMALQGTSNGALQGQANGEAEVVNWIREELGEGGRSPTGSRKMATTGKADPFRAF